MSLQSSTQARPSRARDVRVGLESSPFDPRRQVSALATVGSYPADAVFDVPDFEVDRNLAYEALKRALDIVGAIVLLIVTAPLWLVAAVAVKLSDFGPVFYVHKRVGKGGREFTCLKFRSMTLDADRLKAQLASQNKHNDQRTFKLEEDPRITPLGRLLRKSSIDELPQLWHVLTGEMSLVGPRASIPEEVAIYNWHDRLRLSVRPGLTCIWQVSGRSNLAFPEQLRLDLQYIEQRSMWLDVKLLILTVPAVLNCRGAY